MRKAEFRAEDQFGGELSAEQRALARERAGNLWDAEQKDEAPAEKAFRVLENARSPEITNSLQRIGALGGASTSGIDYTKKTAKTTEDILAEIRKIMAKSPEQQGGMYFT